MMLKLCSILDYLLATNMTRDTDFILFMGTMAMMSMIIGVTMFWFFISMTFLHLLSFSSNFSFSMFMFMFMFMFILMSMTMMFIKHSSMAVPNNNSINGQDDKISNKEEQIGYRKQGFCAVL